MKIVFLFAVILLAGVSARSIRRYDATADCFHDVKEIAALIPQFINGASNMDLNTLIFTAFSVKPLLERTARDCARGDWLKFVNKSAIQGPAECLSDILAIVPKLQNLFEDLAAGNITQVIIDIQEMMPLIQKTIQDCGGSVRKFNAKKLINFYNTPQCQAIREESLPVFQQLAMALFTKNFRQVSEALPQTIEQLLHIVHTCSVKPHNYNFLENANEQNGCVEDIVAIVNLVPQIISHIQAKDIAALISDAQKLVTLLQQAKKDCIGQLKRVNPMDYVNMTTVNDLAKCLQDIVDMIPNLKKLIEDVTAGNISAIIEDIQHLVPKINQTIIDCSQVQPKNLKYLINFYRDGKCMNEIKQVQTQVMFLAMVYQQGDMMAFKQLSEGIVRQAGATIKACSKRRSVGLYQKYIR